MTDTRHINPEDLALHAMQLFSMDEAAIVQEHLEQCTECQAEFHSAQSDLALVALTVELQTPAPETRERFLRQIAREKRIVSINGEAAAKTFSLSSQPRQPKRTGGGLVPWLGWAVAAGVTFSAFGLYHERTQLQTTIADQSLQLKTQTAQMATLTADASRAQAIMDALTDSNAMRVTLNTTPSAKPVPQGRATYIADKGTLVFIANNLAPLPPEKTYELWIIPANGTSPVPAGTFRPDARGNASVVTPSIPAGVQAKAFGVTIEAQGGSATPTMPIILAGA